RKVQGAQQHLARTRRGDGGLVVLEVGGGGLAVGAGGEEDAAIDGRGAHPSSVDPMAGPRPATDPPGLGGRPPWPSSGARPRTPKTPEPWFGGLREGRP